MERRQSRPFQTRPSTASPGEDLPPVSPSLIAHLDERFAKELPARENGVDGAVNNLMTIAEQRGREEVINYLVFLSTNQPGA